MGALKKITSTNKGSITSVQAIYVPADDLTGSSCNLICYLDATTGIKTDSELGIYPAVDP